MSKVNIWINDYICILFKNMAETPEEPKTEVL